MSITKTQSIKAFLTAMAPSDLAELYHHNMECQVNVAQDGGHPIQGEYAGRQWKGWSDGIQEWKPFRIPFNASKEPEYNDGPITWDLAAHAEGIGMTGWDWVSKASRWVAYDFDAIVGHSSKHAKKLTQVELDAVHQALVEIPWVTIRKSTSGRGLHVYVFIEPALFHQDKIMTHTEHAALARAILSRLSALAGCDFQAKVDTCGGNMWVWHRKMKGTDGLTLVKKATCTLSELPLNWRDHVKVVSGRSKRTHPAGIVNTKAQDSDALFEELTGQRARIPLDEGHKALLEFLQEKDYMWTWDSDHHMLITHTWYLGQAQELLNMRGVFKTLAKGEHAKTDMNCFLFPIKDGAWVVRRYSQGCQEAETWTQDGQGWTRCYLNRDVDIETAARASSGVELPKGGYSFKYASEVIDAIKLLGTHVEIPAKAIHRTAEIKEHKDGRLIVSIPQEPHDGQDFQGWHLDKNKWTRIFNIRKVSNSEPEISDYDNIIRHCVTSTGSDYGWCVHSEGTWRDEPLAHVKFALSSLNIGGSEINNILGNSVFKPWTYVNLPFQPEYPGNRQWNREAPQFSVTKKEGDDLHYPTWKKMLEHIGAGLDQAIKNHPWCQVNGVATGADYLKCWIASLCQAPTQPLPYLFLHGPQNSGKSILHEALDLLLTKGVVRADYALTSKSNFNGELKNAILCIVEETSLKDNSSAYNKIKDWVTSQNLAIRDLYQTTYTVPNTTHWIQCNNHHDACPIFQGDTRITMIFVDAIDPTQMIIKKDMLALLKKEAPDFLAALFKMELPPSNDRLNIPVIQTEDKRVVENLNRGLLEEFLEEKCHYVKGSIMSFADFYDKFSAWIPQEEIHNWSNKKVAKALPPKFPKGRLASKANIVAVGNISFEPAPHTGKLCVVRDGQLTTTDE